MSPTSWVIGAGGLLGSATQSRLVQLRQAVFTSSPICWGTTTVSAQLGEQFTRFIDAAGTGPWTIYWCAGAGVTESTEEKLATEIDTIAAFLRVVEAADDDVRRRGAIVFASSAGAVYGGSAGAPFSELTETRALGHYGRAKLAAESLFSRFSSRSKVACFVARIANLYGPGQSLRKQQGLVSRLCMSALTRQPISVFVDLDTLRDYIYVDDCAQLLVSAADRLHRSSVGSTTIKIIASGTSHSIASILGHFSRGRGADPLVILGSSPHAALQSRDLRLRSVVWPELDMGVITPLPVGIDRTMQDLRARLLLADSSAAVAVQG